MRTPKSRRAIAATLVLVLLLITAPAVAQASTGSHSDPSWIEWVLDHVAHFWQQVVAVAIAQPDVEDQPGPKP